MSETVKKKYDFGHHEICHVSMILAETVDERLCQHEWIKENKEWSRMAKNACDTLHDLYQSIGRYGAENQ